MNAMSGDNPDNVSRRSVMKQIGAGAVIGSGAIYGGVEVTAAASGLENQSVFVENGAKFNLPKESDQTNTLEKADTAVLKSDTNLPRRRLLDFLKQSNSISFAGHNAEEGLHAFLYNSNRDVIPASSNVNRAKPSGLEEYTFGAEYNRTLGSSSATVVPTGSKLSISVSREETTEKKIAKEISTALERHDPNAGGIGTMGENKETTCADREDFTCLGEYEDSGTTKPYGKYKVQIQLYEMNSDGDPNHNYHPFVVTMTSRPGAMYDTWSTQDWENYEMYRQTDFFDTYSIDDVDPTSTTGSTGESYEASIAPDGGGLSYQWSYSISEVTVEDYSETGGKAIGEHVHTIDNSDHTNATDTRWVSEPGYMVKVDADQTEIAYNLEEHWKWEDPNTCFGCGDRNYHTVVGSGDGHWNI
jgi:hypothetical protein